MIVRPFWTTLCVPVRNVRLRHVFCYTQKLSFGWCVNATKLVRMDVRHRLFTRPVTVFRQIVCELTVIVLVLEYFSRVLSQHSY